METITITRLSANDIKQLIAEKYGVNVEDIKAWNSTFEFPIVKKE